MKKVRYYLKRSCTTMLISVFAFSTPFIIPQEAKALTVNVTPSWDVSGTLSRSYTYDICLSDCLTQASIATPTATVSADVAAEQQENSAATAEQTSTSSASTQSSIKTTTLAAGTKYATKLYIIDSGKPGPTVMIVGGIHGNETAGYKAAATFTDCEIKKGKLLVLPEANKLAIENHVRYLSYYGDLNRDFPTSSTDSPNGTIAKAIYAAVKQYDVDWLMDMHEGYDYYKNTSTDSVGQSLIYYPNSSTSAVATKIVSSLNAGISGTYYDFSLLRYPVKGSLARAVGQYLGVHSFIFETCSKPALSVRVNRQVKAANIMLTELGMK